MSLLRSYGRRIDNVLTDIEMLYDRQAKGKDVLTEILEAQAKLQMLIRNRDNAIMANPDEAHHLARRAEL